MTAEGRRILLVGFHQAVPLPQLTGHHARVQMNIQPLDLEKSIQMFLANLHGTKGGIPLPSRTRPCGSLYIFDSGIGQGQNGAQVAHDARFGFPPTPCRRGGPPS